MLLRALDMHVFAVKQGSQLWVREIPPQGKSLEGYLSQTLADQSCWNVDFSSDVREVIASGRAKMWCIKDVTTWQNSSMNNTVFLLAAVHIIYSTSFETTVMTRAAKNAWGRQCGNHCCNALWRICWKCRVGIVCGCGCPLSDNWRARLSRLNVQ